MTICGSYALDIYNLYELCPRLIVPNELFAHGGTVPGCPPINCAMTHCQGTKKYDTYSQSQYESSSCSALSDIASLSAIRLSIKTTTVAARELWKEKVSRGQLKVN